MIHIPVVIAMAVGSYAARHPAVNRAIHHVSRAIHQAIVANANFAVQHPAVHQAAHKVVHEATMRSVEYVAGKTLEGIDDVVKEVRGPKL